MTTRESQLKIIRQITSSAVKDKHDDSAYSGYHPYNMTSLNAFSDDEIEQILNNLQPHFEEVSSHKAQIKELTNTMDSKIKHVVDEANRRRKLNELQKSFDLNALLNEQTPVEAPWVQREMES